jgi:hypothetical protein
MEEDIRLSSLEVVLSFKVGDKVTTDFYGEDKQVVRKITNIEHNTGTSSTVKISADDGGVCKCCNRPLSKPIYGIDGFWFFPVKK